MLHTLAKTGGNGYNRAIGRGPGPPSVAFAMSKQCLYFLFYAVLAICNCKLLKSVIGLHCEMV